MTSQMVVDGNHAMNEESVCKIDSLSAVRPDGRTTENDIKSQLDDRRIIAGSAAIATPSPILVTTVGLLDTTTSTIQ